MTCRWPSHDRLIEIAVRGFDTGPPEHEPGSWASPAGRVRRKTVEEQTYPRNDVPLARRMDRQGRLFVCFDGNRNRGGIPVVPSRQEIPEQGGRYESGRSLSWARRGKSRARLLMAASVQYRAVSGGCCLAVQIADQSRGDQTNEEESEFPILIEQLHDLPVRDRQ